VPADVRVFDDAETLGHALADEILARYARGGRRFLLGCPGGRSLRSTYRALACRGEPLDRLVVVMMDEYVVDGAPAPRDAHFSCRAFAQREIAGPLRVAESNVLVPDPGDAAAYDERIAVLGGIDLFLLASGASDGHVAFLPPGSPLDGRTSNVEVAESTRRDNVATFPEFANVSEVPTHGVSVGLGTIRAAKALRLVLHGRDKHAAAARVLGLDRFDPSWPASVVHTHADAEIWLDREAASSPPPA
jgi:glucosamine-6-phosphate deaminase